MEGPELNEKGYFYSAIARELILMSKCMFGGRAPPGLLREPKRFPDLIFRPQNTKKRLAAGLGRPDPLGELERSPSPLRCSGCHEMEHSLAAVRGALRRGRGCGIQNIIIHQFLMTNNKTNIIVNLWPLFHVFK